MDEMLVFVAKHANRFPEGLLRAVFHAAADSAWALHVGGVKQLERNLVHVLSWKAEQQGVQITPHVMKKIQRSARRMSKQAMRSYFAYFAEAMSVGARTEDELRARVRGTGSGFESLREFVREQHGSVPVAMGHQGNWDYAGFWAQFEVAPVTTVAEKLGNYDLLKTFVSIREQLGMRILLTGSKGLTKRLEDVLEDDSPVVVPLLADRDLSRHGEFVEAFDSIIRVARGPAALAYDTALPLYVVNMYRERLTGETRKRAHAKYGYVVEISGPIDIEEARKLPRTEALRAISQAWVNEWMQGIARHPADWHMLQPLFIEDMDLNRLKEVPASIKLKVRRDKCELLNQWQEQQAKQAKQSTAKEVSSDREEPTASERA